MIGKTVVPDGPRLAGNGITGVNDAPGARSGIGSGNGAVALFAPIEAAVIVPFVAIAPEFVRATVSDVPLAVAVKIGFDAFMIGTLD